MKQFTSLALIPFLVGALPAQGESISSARISNFTVTLTDLDPDDGIAPAITFNTAAKYNARVGVEVTEFYDHAPKYQIRSVEQAAGKFGPLNVTEDTEFVTATGSVLGDGTLAGTVLTAAGRASNEPGTEGVFYAGAHMLRDTTNTRSADAFRLSAHTRAEFSIDVDLFAHLAEESLETSPYRIAAAFSELMVLGRGVGDHLGVHFTYVNLKVEENSDSIFRDNGRRLQTSSRVTYENVTADWLGGAVGVSAYVHGSSKAVVSTPLPTPLPGSLLFLVSGLALVGWRRSAQRR